ncbi:10392_t:CDS:2 [Paraglomus occultum]|uniref:10392_t:CDS:1 n=1 Tax=Paraglomus occultum TaxID=144539 RepID=A0A9N8ZJF5_9GLOM|nr:10392_t:CDS:2 [Paraglomus occultum]
MGAPTSYYPDQHYVWNNPSVIASFSQDVQHYGTESSYHLDHQYVTRSTPQSATSSYSRNHQYVTRSTPQSATASYFRNHQYVTRSTPQSATSSYSRNHQYVTRSTPQSATSSYSRNQRYVCSQESENVTYSYQASYPISGVSSQPLYENYLQETENSDIITTSEPATSIEPAKSAQAEESLNENYPLETKNDVRYSRTFNVITTNLIPATTQPSPSPQARTALVSRRDINSDTSKSRRHSVRFSTLRPMGQFGQCDECKSTRTGYNWCQYCNNEQFQKDFANWTSGSGEIDDFIQVAQLKATNVRSVLEWIDYKEFTNVKHLANGGNSSVFTAYWPRGPIRTWDANGDEWERGWGQANSDLGAYHQFSTLVSHVVRCYGISRCPFTNEFIVVTSYAEDGDLRQYMSKNFDNFTLQKKIITLRDIASGLVTIHRAGLLHKDLHTGNILRSGTWTMISDLGLCWHNASVTGNEKTVHGVLPYVAPEVLRGMPYTRAADVYSVGMIMYELWTGRPPFEEKDYDLPLAMNICSGTRPDIPSDVPAYYSIIMQACWDQDPDMRPTSRELERTFEIWIEKIANGELPCPKTFANKKSVDLTTQKDESSLYSIPERSMSQPIPPLSADQHVILNKLDERREALYQRCLDDRLIEMAEERSKNQEQVNPMTWTRELKTLADEIFGSSVNVLPITFNTVTTEPEPTRTAGNNRRQNRKSK